jgi:hypothetical protein
MIVRLACERPDLIEIEAHERELVVILPSKSVQPGSIGLDQPGHLQLANEIFERKLEMRRFHEMPVEDQEMELANHELRCAGLFGREWYRSRCFQLLRLAWGVFAPSALPEPDCGGERIDASFFPPG